MGAGENLHRLESYLGDVAKLLAVSDTEKKLFQGLVC